MSILTSIAKQLLILDDKLHQYSAHRAAVKADELRHKAACKHSDHCKAARVRIKQAHAEGAALVAMHEHALRRAKSEQIALVAAAEAHLNSVDARFEEDKARATKRDGVALGHVVRSQKAREAVQAL